MSRAVDWLLKKEVEVISRQGRMRHGGSLLVVASAA